MGKPNEREIHIFIMLQESTKQQQTHISSQGKYLIAPNMSHRNLPHFPCQNRTVVRHPFASFSMPTFSCTDCSVRPKNNKQKTKIRLEIHAVVRTVRNHTDYTDPYSTTSHNRKIFRPKIHRKFFSGFMSSFLEKCALFAAHFPLSSMLRKSL
jgi:hypothetical protein